MKKLTFLLSLLVISLWSCTKDITETLSPNDAEQSLTRAAENPLDEFVNKPVFLQTFLGEGNDFKTCFLTIEFETLKNDTIKSKLKFLPAIAAEPKIKSMHPDSLKRQMWYIRSTTEGKYYIESALCTLENEDNIHTLFGDTQFWDYWLMSYGQSKIGAYNTPGALQCHLAPTNIMPAEYCFTFIKQDIPNKDIYRIKTEPKNALFNGFYIQYPNPNTDGGQIQMVKEASENFSNFEIVLSEGLVFDRIEYDIDIARLRYKDIYIKQYEFSNVNSTDPIVRNYLYNKYEKKISKWSENKETQFNTSHHFSVSVPFFQKRTDSGKIEYELAIDYTSTDTQMYDETIETMTTEESTTNITIAPLRRVIVDHIVAEFRATVPYTIYYRGSTTGKTYEVHGAWEGVSFLRESFLETDITDSDNPFFIKATVDSKEVSEESYDQTISIEYEKEGNGFYRIYYSFFNPTFVNPSFIMSIYKNVGSQTDLMEYRPDGQGVEEDGRRYFRFHFPTGGTSYEIFVRAEAGGKEAIGRMLINEAH